MPIVFAVAIVFAAVVALVTFRSVIVVPNDSAYVVERLGRHRRTLGPGLHVLVPFVDRIAFRFSATPREDELTEVCITHDNVPVTVRSTLVWQIADPQKAAYETANVSELVLTVAKEAQRRLVGERSIDDVRESTRELQSAIVRAASEPAATVGVKIVSLAIQSVDRAR